MRVNWVEPLLRVGTAVAFALGVGDAVDISRNALQRNSRPGGGGGLQQPIVAGMLQPEKRIPFCGVGAGTASQLGEVIVIWKSVFKIIITVSS